MYSLNNYFEGKEITISFGSAEEMGSYIKRESSYCAVARSNYLAALGREEIDRTKKAFHDKRIEFARMSGFSPASKNSTVWTRESSESENNGAA